MKALYSLLFLVLPYLSFSQTIIYSQDFEGLNSNELLEPQSTEFNGWWGDFTSAFVSTQFAHSGSNSVVIWNNGTVGANNPVSDAVLEFSDIDNGMYELSFFVYQPSTTTQDPVVNAGGYYNLLQQYDAAASSALWAMEMYFMDQSQMATLGYTGLLAAGGGVVIQFNTIYDQWIEVKHEINLDSDLISVYYDGVLLHSWQYSLTASGALGVAEIAAIDLYAACVPQNVTASCEPEIYFDDFSLVSYPTTNLNNTSDFSFVQYPNPTLGLVNYTVNVPYATTIQLSITNVKGVKVYNQILDLKEGEKNITLNLNHLISGVYYVNILTKNNVLTKKLVIE